MKYYIVTFDRNNSASYSEFHEDFISTNIIKGWFHYIKSSYIVASNNSAGDISRHFTYSAKKNNLPTTHLVVEVNLSSRQGMLVEDAWKWIRKNC